MRRRRVRGMRAYWDRAAEQNALWYVDTSLSFEDPDVERFLATGESIVAEAVDDAPVRPERTAVALEIGCGLGRVCAALARRFDRVIGVDISAEMLHRARALVVDERVELVQGDGATLDGVGDASTDVVLSFTVFQHIPDDRIIGSYLREAGRVLRPGGILVFQWNNTPGAWRWRVRRAWLSALQRSGLRPERHQRHAPEFLGTRVSLRRIERMLRDGGLALVATKNRGNLYAWAWARRG